MWHKSWILWIAFFSLGPNNIVEKFWGIPYSCSLANINDVLFVLYLKKNAYILKYTILCLCLKYLCTVRCSLGLYLMMRIWQVRPFRGNEIVMELFLLRRCKKQIVMIFNINFTPWEMYSYPVSKIIKAMKEETTTSSFAVRYEFYLNYGFQ